MSKEKLAVSTEKPGWVVIEPLMGPGTRLRVANGFVEVKSHHRFWIFVCNFGQVERSLQKNMVFESA